MAEENSKPNRRPTRAKYAGRCLMLGLSLAVAGIATVVLASGPPPANASFPGANKKIAFTKNQNVFAIDPADASTTQLTTDPAFDVAGGWSPDGSKLAFISDRDGAPDVFVMNADGSGQTNVSHLASNPLPAPPDGFEPNFADSPTWSPDGTKILFDNQRDIWAINVDGSGLTNLTNDFQTFDHSPSWSPNGSRIAFSSDRATGNDRSQIFTMKPDGSEITRVTQSAAFDVRPDWAPNGTKLVFTRFVPLQGWDVNTISPAGSGEVALTATHDAMEATWSPDGTKIGFISGAGNGDDIAVMGADGSNPTDVATTNDSETGPISWQPEPGSTPTNVAPSCPPGEYTIASGQPLELTANCTDLDGPNSLTYSIVNGPSTGSLSIDSGNTATYRSFIGFTGDDSFTYRADDGADSTTATVTIHVTGTPSGNQPPACPESNAFVESGGSVVLHANCTDPENDPITYGVVPFPSGGVTGGSITDITPTSVRYTPNQGTTSDNFTYTATDAQHAAISTIVHITVTGPGEDTFATAPEATQTDPYVASVTTPQPGPVTMDARTVTATPPDGFFLLNQEFDITWSTPTGEDGIASASDPLRLVFTIDESNVPPDPITVFRDGEAVTECAAGGVADPDPCVDDASTNGNGDLQITVLSTHASRWNLGVAAPAQPYDFSGFFQPVDNPPTLNLTKAGAGIPVKFSLGGDEGLAVLDAGYPKSQDMPCSSTADVDGIESTASASSNGLSYDAASDTYTYVWKTSKGWSNTCRQLVLRFNDHPYLSTYRANFKFSR